MMCAFVREKNEWVGTVRAAAPSRNAPRSRFATRAREPSPARAPDKKKDHSCALAGR